MRHHQESIDGVKLALKALRECFSRIHIVVSDHCTPFGIVDWLGVSQVLFGLFGEAEWKLRPCDVGSSNFIDLHDLHAQRGWTRLNWTLWGTATGVIGMLEAGTHPWGPDVETTLVMTLIYCIFIIYHYIIYLEPEMHSFLDTIFRIHPYVQISIFYIKGRVLAKGCELNIGVNSSNMTFSETSIVEI